MHRAAVVDEYGELKRKEAAFQPTVARLRVLRSFIEGWIPPDHPADQPLSFSGKLYDVNCTMRRQERRVSRLSALMRAIGRSRFFRVITVGVGVLEAEIGEEQAATWFDQKRTGPREISAVLREAAPEAA